MDLRSGYPLWLVKSGLPYSYPKLGKDIKTHTVVMGGGISGALVAHYLVKNGIDCVIADRRTIGLGSTCASTALLQYQIDTSLSKLTAMVGRQQALRAYKLCAESVNTLERLAAKIGLSDFERRPTLFYASAKKDVSLIGEEYELHRKAGFDVQYWDAILIKRRFGLNAPAALFSNHSAQTDAYLYTHALLRYNCNRGLRVFDRTTIENISHGRKEVVLKTAEGYTIRARKLVYATGYESVKYIRKKIVDLHSTYAIATENTAVAQPWYKNALLWETRQPYLYMSPLQGNRIIIGGRDEPFSNPGKRDQLIKKKSRQLENDFGKLFPQVECKTEFSWTGTFGVTRDGLPYIGNYTPLTNALFALGFGGNGITFSLIAAKIIADLIKGRPNKDSNLFSFNR